MQTTSLQLDCTISAASQDELEKELAQIRSCAYAAFGISPAKQAPPQQSARGQGTPARTRQPTRRQRASTTRQRRTAASRQAASNGHVTDQQMLAVLTTHDGMTAKALAEQTGMSPSATLSHLHKLEKTGGVIRQGTRANTRWFAKQAVAIAA